MFQLFNALPLFFNHFAHKFCQLVRGYASGDCLCPFDLNDTTLDRNLPFDVVHQKNKGVLVILQNYVIASLCVGGLASLQLLQTDVHSALLLKGEFVVHLSKYDTPALPPHRFKALLLDWKGKRLIQFFFDEKDARGYFKKHYEDPSIQMGRDEPCADGVGGHLSDLFMGLLRFPDQVGTLGNKRWGRGLKMTYPLLIEFELGQQQRICGEHALIFLWENKPNPHSL